MSRKPQTSHRFPQASHRPKHQQDPTYSQPRNLHHKYLPTDRQISKTLLKENCTIYLDSSKSPWRLCHKPNDEIPLDNSPPMNYFTWPSEKNHITFISDGSDRQDFIVSDRGQLMPYDKDERTSDKTRISTPNRSNFLQFVRIWQDHAEFMIALEKLQWRERRIRMPSPDSRHRIKELKRDERRKAMTQVKVGMQLDEDGANLSELCARKPFKGRRWNESKGAQGRKA